MSLTVIDAAKIMGVSPQFLRQALREDKFPFGTAVKSSENRYVYYINKARFHEYMRDN